MSAVTEAKKACLGQILSTERWVERWSESSRLPGGFLKYLLVIDKMGWGTVGDIASQVIPTQQSAGRVIRRMEKFGLVVTEEGDKDRRLVLVELTPKGRSAANHVVAGYQ
jgi:DNA-binding MarR family transcriptional regulator